VTLGLTGNAGSIGTISDKQVGISLSVTPTFVDNESMILAIKFTRSFVQPGLAGSASSFSQQLTSSRNAVNANVFVRFGETLILSGLTEREVQRNESGLPLLKDVPLLQYFFNVRQNSDFNRSVLIMLTPRKVVSTEEDKALAIFERNNKDNKSGSKKTYAFHWRIEDFEKTLSKYAPNLDTVVQRLQSNQLYDNFSSKDLTDDTWMSQGRLNNLLRDIKETLYH
jgi:type II secretory pathway component GspD/PulD (secretin)